MAGGGAGVAETDGVLDVVLTDDVTIGVAGAVVTGVTGTRVVTAAGVIAEARGMASAASCARIIGSLLVNWVRGLCWVKSQ